MIKSPYDKDDEMALVGNTEMVLLSSGWGPMEPHCVRLSPVVLRENGVNIQLSLKLSQLSALPNSITVGRNPNDLLSLASIQRLAGHTPSSLLEVQAS